MNLAHKPTVYHYILAFVFILLMVCGAVYFQDPEIVLPEIAALAVGLWVFQEKA